MAWKAAALSLPEGIAYLAMPVGRAVHEVSPLFCTPDADADKTSVIAMDVTVAAAEALAIKEAVLIVTT